MRKAIYDDRACFVTENLDEAKSLLAALDTVRPFYTEHGGEIIEITDIKDVTVTIVFTAKIRVLEGEERK
jgi:hypothetical protein